MCFLSLLEGESITGHTFGKDMLLEFVVFEHRVVCGIYFEIDYHFYTQISWEGSEQHCHLSVIGKGFLVVHYAATVIIDKDKGIVAGVST